jgi:hypothetical protein
MGDPIPKIAKAKKKKKEKNGWRGDDSSGKAPA